MPVFLWSVVQWLASAIASIAAYLTTYIGKRIALLTAAIAVLLTLTTAMWAAIEAVLAGIQVAAPAELSIALGWFAPGNVPECAAAWMSAKVIRFAYDFKSRGAQMRLL